MREGGRDGQKREGKVMRVGVLVYGTPTAICLIFAPYGRLYTIKFLFFFFSIELGRIAVLYFLYIFYKKYFFAEQAELWPKILREVLFRLFLLEVAKSS